VALFPGVSGYPGFTDARAVLAAFGKPGRSHPVGYAIDRRGAEAVIPWWGVMGWQGGATDRSIRRFEAFDLYLCGAGGGTSLSMAASWSSVGCHWPAAALART